MEKANKSYRKIRLNLGLTQEEYQIITNNFNQTMDRRIPDYIRKVLLGKPMIGCYRNRTMDDLMNVLVGLKNELNSIVNTYNQTFKLLSTVEQITEDKS